jgi:hypothetical protein
LLRSPKNQGGTAKARQRRDFLFGQLGRKPLQTDVGKTDRRH